MILTYETHCACPQQKYNTSKLDKHPLMCVQVRSGQMFMDSNMRFFHRHVHISSVFKFSLQGSHHVSCPFPAGESKDRMCCYLLVLCVFSMAAFLPVLCRYLVMGGVSGFTGAKCVFVSHLFYSSNVLSAAVCSGGENVYSRGSDPLCHLGKRKIVFQRSD